MNIRNMTDEQIMGIRADSYETDAELLALQPNGNPTPYQAYNQGMAQQQQPQRPLQPQPQQVSQPLSRLQIFQDMLQRAYGGWGSLFGYGGDQQQAPGGGGQSLRTNGHAINLRNHMNGGNRVMDAEARSLR